MSENISNMSAPASGGVAPVLGFGGCIVGATVIDVLIIMVHPGHRG